ncbi:MAG: 5-formyltetrahydrofolate cyclo-ligase [Hyphomicrobiaceae bacterium]
MTAKASIAPDSVTQAKAALRARMRAWRDGLDSAAKVRAAEAIAERGLALVSGLRGSAGHGIVSAFAAMPEELNVWLLLRQLHGVGVPLALPVVEGKGRPLVFRPWAPGDAMDKGVWGIPQPKPDRPAVEPDILLVPLLAFDAQGRRLGYGGGFYDRTLAGLRARKRIVAVGLAYDEQRIDAVPHLDYDQQLDWVLTPSGPMRCSSDASAVSR